MSKIAVLEGGREREGLGFLCTYTAHQWRRRESNMTVVLRNFLPLPYPALHTPTPTDDVRSGRSVDNPKINSNADPFRLSMSVWIGMDTKIGPTRRLK